MADLFLRVLKYIWMVLWVFSPPYIIDISTFACMVKAPLFSHPLYHCGHHYRFTTVMTFVPWWSLTYCISLPIDTYNSIFTAHWQTQSYDALLPLTKFTQYSKGCLLPFVKFHLQLKQRLCFYFNPPETELVSLFVSLWWFDSGGYLLGVETYIITLFSLHLYQYT